MSQTFYTAQFTFCFAYNN